MNIKSVLTHLRQSNIMVRVKGNDLSVVAEKGVLSPETKAMLANHKQAIVSYLRELQQTEASEIQIVDRSSPLPLSSGQQRLWFLAQLEPASSAYVIPVAVRIDGSLQPSLLKQALGKIIDRHEVLRTVFKTEDEGEPRQVILNEIAVPFLVVDLRRNSPADQEIKLEECVRREMSKPFNLSGGPLLRAVVLQLGEQEHVLFLGLHHIVADGWSIPILVRELSAFYVASQNGRSADLPTLPVQYADYASWQRRWDESGARARQLAYWEKQLADLVPLTFPTDHPRNEHSSARGATATFVISGTLASRLRLLGLEEDATLFMVFLAAFKVLLSRYCSQNQIAVGTPVANRERREIQGLIGFFVNTLVLFTHANQSSRFRDLLRQVRKTVLDALENQDLPFEQLVDHLRPERRLNQNPLFEVMFILENSPRSDMRVGDITLRPLELKGLTSKFDLTLSLAPEGDGLQGRLNYNCELFEPATIHRMIAHYQQVLEGIAGQPDQSIAGVPLLTQAEREQLLVEWNRTAVEYPKATLVELFEQQADKTPEGVAVEYADQQLTYVELNRKANQLAHYLQELGVGPEVRVGICVDRSLEMVVALLGVLKAGGAYVPMDPRYPKERLQWMLDDMQPAVLLTQSSIETVLPPVAGKIIRLDREWEEIGSRSGENLGCEVNGDNLAYTLYTSGSTGRPKAVGIRHSSAAVLVQWAREVVSPEELNGMLASTSICFDLSVYEIFVPLSWGGRVIVPGNVLDLATMSAREQVKVVNTCPSIMQEILRIQGLPRSVVTVNLAGEALAMPLVQELYGIGSVRRVLNLYGPSEDTTYSTYKWIKKEEAEAGEKATVSIGKPITNTRVYVLDERMEPVPIGVAGELYIGGAGLARGYLNRPELTAERFVPGPFVQQKMGNGERLYRTGNFVRWLPDGNLEFLGRLDDQVKIRGQRIELGEIEAMLQQHPAVTQAAVIVLGEQQAQRRLIGYVVRNESGVEGGNQPLREYLRSRLPEYMVPKVIMEMRSLPLTPNGKLDRRALAKIAPEEQREERTYVAPRTPEEEVLATIWAELLQVERVGIHDNFFELGGHSLLAMQQISRVRKVFAVELSVRELFETRTLAGLAARIEEKRLRAKPDAMPPLRRGERTEPVPLSFAQQRLWFLDQLEPGNTAYNMPLALWIVGKLNRDALQWALQEIVNRHEVLRTRFPQQSGVPVQEIQSELKIKIQEIDLAGVEETKREEEADREAAAEAEIAFDLARGPLMRVKLLRLAEKEHVLMVTMHHIVSDGWSMGVMVKEFSQLYAARCQGEEGGLPELPIQYADFSMWQRDWLQGSVLEQELEHWRQRLKGVAALDLPTDREWPAVMSHAGASLSFKVGGECLRGLKRVGRRQGATLYMTCLAAWQALLYRYTGQEDIAVGSPIAGRRWTETEGLIGFLVNTLVIRSGVRGEQRFTDLLQQVKENTLEAYAHQDVPFEKVVEELEPERDLRRTPLFQVMFTLQSRPRLEMEVGEINLIPFPVEIRSAKFELLLTLTEENEELQGTLSYNRDLFKAETMQRMIGHYSRLLGGIGERWEDKIADMPLLENRERHHLLVEWNRTGVEYPNQTIIELFEQQVRKTGKAVAVEYEREHLTYAELNRRANQLGRYLRKLGVGPDVRVGLCMERSIEMVVAILGVLKAGGAYVPIDPDYPAERLQFMVEEAQIPVVLTQEKLVMDFSSWKTRVVKVDRQWELVGDERGENLKVTIDPESLAYVIYTSGSTGRPKGAMNTHAGLRNRLQWMQEQYQLRADDRVLQKTPYSFDVSVWEFFWPWMVGAKLVIARAGGHRDPEYLAELIEKRKITTLHFVPSMLAAFLESGGDRKCGSVRRVICSGEALSPELAEKFAERMDVGLHNLYGPTEASIDVTYWKYDSAKINNRVPIGTPIANTQVYVLDQFGQPVPLLVAGELYLGGRGLARGYVNRPDLTAERFVPDHLSGCTGERLYRTGDKVRWRRDGKLEYLGRLDDQVKIRGFRIELGEIEAVLREHEKVRRAAVVVREDHPGDKRLVAYVVPELEESGNGNGRGGLLTSELSEYLRGKLPEYMVPSAYVQLAELPLNHNGKIERKSLPQPDAHTPEEDYVGPRNATEEILCQLWQEVLRRERVGIHDNFFKIGGHSLLAAQVATRMREHFQLNIPLRQMFESPTIAQLAEVIDQALQTAGVNGGQLHLLPAVTRVARKAALLPAARLG